MRWTEQQAREVQTRLQARIADPLAPVPRRPLRSKYRNVRVMWNGLQFDSMLELKNHQKFLAQRACGMVRGVSRQVSLTLPESSRRIRVDHVIFENDGRVSWYDSKGFTTAAWELKAQMVKDAYGIEIHCI